MEVCGHLDAGQASDGGGEELTEDEIKTCIRKSTIANEMVPVLCGTAYKNKGVQPLLDAIVDYMPAPTDVESIKGTNPRTGEEEFGAALAAGKGFVGIHASHVPPLIMSKPMCFKLVPWFHTSVT